MIESKEILTVKRCGILLAVACCIYFMLNIVVWHMALIVAIVGAICTTIAFGLFLYFIRGIIKKRIKERADKEKKKTRADIVALGKDTDPEICKRLGGRKVNGRCVVVETGIEDDGDVFLNVLKKR